MLQRQKRATHRLSDQLRIRWWLRGPRHRRLRRRLRFLKARHHLLREQLRRGLADVTGLAVDLAHKAQMQVIDAHVRQLPHLGGDRIGRTGDGQLHVVNFANGKKGSAHAFT